jgi:AmmeMemoRadiSam system protein A
MKDLLKLARSVLEAHFENRKLVVSEEVKKKYSKKQACFVTLTLNGELRGCIGSIYPRQELWKDVVENALNAAFNDHRFNPLEKYEFDMIKIEVSVLTVPEKMGYRSLEELKKKIKGKGVILKKDFNSATYLPQVWEDLPNEDEFLSSLCQKAGLPRNAWKENINVLIYEVKAVKE